MWHHHFENCCLTSFLCSTKKQITQTLTEATFPCTLDFEEHAFLYSTHRHFLLFSIEHLYWYFLFVTTTLIMNTNVFIFISLFVDLLAFTLILPLFPSILDCYSKSDNVRIFFFISVNGIYFYFLIRLDCTIRFKVLLFLANI